MNLKQLLLTAAITTACIVSTNLQAKADTYRAGKFTINIFDTETTRVYVGSMLAVTKKTDVSD